MKSNFSIIGCGKLGSALGKELTKNGYPIFGLNSKSKNSARKLASNICTNNISEDPVYLTKNSKLIFITTPDDKIEEVCLQISKNNGFNNNNIVIHCSGSLPSSILMPAKQHGAKIASMHPLQSFASDDIQQNPFEGIYISVEGDKEAVDIIKSVIKDLGAISMDILTKAKTLYHAAAVGASNYLVSLLYFVQELNKNAGISSKDSYKCLKPLILGTLKNIEEFGIPSALTGPIARGDKETIIKHLGEIESWAPELLNIYKLLGRYTVLIAENKGSINKQISNDLNQLLE